MKCKILLPLLLFIFSTASGQVTPTCPPNMDFELGNLSYWTFFNGLAASGSPYTVLTLTPSAPVPGREDLTSGTGVDPYGLFPVVGAGMYSCKLGHDTALYCAERARYQIHVPTGLASYSVIYHYAVVLEDGGHPATTQPRFTVNAYDSASGAAIPCAQFNYVTSSSLPGFLPSKLGFGVIYKPWSTGSMNLTGYGGKTITIDFTAADCGAGGHFGYGYLDMSCGLFAIQNITCNSATATLTAPPGYSAYAWYDSATFTISYGSKDTIIIPTPGVPTTYAVILTPFPGFGCVDTLYTKIFPTNLKIKPSHDTAVCGGTPITLTTGATDVALPLSYMWSGGPGSISCSTCDPTVVTPGFGTNIFKFTVTDAAGCTDVDSIKIDVNGVIPVIKSTNVSCNGYGDGTAWAIPSTGTPPFTYSWSTVPVQTTAKIIGLGPGTYSVNITDASGCTSSTPTTIVQPPPNIIALAGSSDPTKCFTNDGTITISGLTPGAGYTIRYRFNTVPNTASIVATSIGDGILVGLAPGYYDSITVIGSKCPYNVIGPVTLLGLLPPPPPPVTPQRYCQFDTPDTAIAKGSKLTWYVPPATTGYNFPPTPSTNKPGITYYYVTQTVANCPSDSTLDSIVVYPKPAPPITADTAYCQHDLAGAITAIGDSLKWYTAMTGGLPIVPYPVASTDTAGVATWYVDQRELNIYAGGMLACVSDRSPLVVTVHPKPNFYITPQRPWVCQYDSIWLSFTGAPLHTPNYTWTLSNGQFYSTNLYTNNGTSLATDSMVYVRFDSVVQNNYIRLYATDYDKTCPFDTLLRLPVIPHPTATAYTQLDVCVNDTVSLALSTRSPSASVFSWMIDNVPMESTTALSLIAHNSNSGGPFSISWNDSGRHIIQVYASTDEGCKAPPVSDTINVHVLPDASFTFATKNGPLCLEDSVMFIANASSNYNYAYNWSPAHYFENINKGVTWGKVEQSRSVVTLQVSDPFGCSSTTTQELDPNSCCTVNFPNAFSPNGDHKNDLFRPIFVGYHRFHIFRIANRWGQTVYESTNSNMQWDGTFNGVPQDIGVYFYYLKYDCGGATIEKTGDVTLVR